MGFVTNVVTPIFTGVVLLILIAWVGYVLWWMFSKSSSKISFVWKHKIMKRPYPEKDVEWCIHVIDMGWNDVKTTSFLLKKGTPLKRVRYMGYLYDEIKKVKGGIK